MSRKSLALFIRLDERVANRLGNEAAPKAGQWRAAQQQAKEAEPLDQTEAVLNQPLPQARLVNISGNILDDQKLRRGKVVLTFTLTTCAICDQEDDFLATVVDNRKDVSFYYVIPFGPKEDILKSAQSNIKPIKSILIEPSGNW